MRVHVDAALRMQPRDGTPPNLQAQGGPQPLPGTGAAQAGGGSQITFALLDIERRREAEVRTAQAQASLQRIIDTAPLAEAMTAARIPAVSRAARTTGAGIRRSSWPVPIRGGLGGLHASYSSSRTNGGSGARGGW